MKLFRKINYSLLKARIIAASLFLVPTLILLFVYPQANDSRKNNSDTAVRKQNPFSGLLLSAKSVFVWDVNGQRIPYSKNEKEQSPLASLSKVMTALVAMDRMPSGAKVKITADSIRQEGDSKLRNGEEWKLKDLIDFSLISSSNDGIYAVASAAESLKRNLEINPPLTTVSENQSDKETARLFTPHYKLGLNPRSL